MSTLHVRVNAQTYESDLERGAQLAGSIYSVEATARSQRDVTLPIGYNIQPAAFDVEPGRYVVEVALPSGRLLSDEVEVGRDQTVSVELDATDSPYETLSWQYIVGNVEPSGVYHNKESVPVPRSVGSRFEPHPSSLRSVWCFGSAENGIELDRVLGIAEDPADLALSRFVDEPWVERSGEIAPSAETDPLTPLFRFDSKTFVNVSAGTPGRRFLLVRSADTGYVVTLPVPWTDMRSGSESTIEVMVNARQSPLGNPIAVAVRDPTVGAGLAYLSNGALSHAATLLGDVQGMLYGKVSNPLGAAAGAYVLVGTELSQDRQVWDDWIDNLDKGFPYFSDGSILRAVRLLKTAKHETDFDAARAEFVEASRRGLPIYTLGLSWLIDGLSEFPDDADCVQALQLARRLSWRVDMREPFVVVRMGESK